MTISRLLFLAAFLATATSSPIGADRRLANVRRSPAEELEQRHPQLSPPPLGTQTGSSIDVVVSLSVGASDSAAATTTVNPGGSEISDSISLPSRTVELAPATTTTKPPGPPGPPGAGPPVLVKKTSSTTDSLITTLISDVLEPCTTTLSQTAADPCTDVDITITVYPSTVVSTAYVNCGGCTVLDVVPELFFCGFESIVGTITVATPTTQWATACALSTATAVADSSSSPPTLSASSDASSVVVLTSVDLATTIDSVASSTTDSVAATSIDSVAATTLEMRGISPPGLTKASTATATSVVTTVDLAVATPPPCGLSWGKKRMA